MVSSIERFHCISEKLPAQNNSTHQKHWEAWHTPHSGHHSPASPSEQWHCWAHPAHHLGRLLLSLLHGLVGTASKSIHCAWIERIIQYNCIQHMLATQHWSYVGISVSYRHSTHCRAGIRTHTHQNVWPLTTYSHKWWLCRYASTYT